MNSPTPRTENDPAPAEPNALARTLGLLGDEWTLLVLRQAHLGASRYHEFKEQLDISDAVLADRLRRLAEGRLFDRVVYQHNPVRAGYALTASGAATWPILFGIWHWERHWVAGRGDDLPAMVHRACGRPFEPVLGCGTCGRRATIDRLHLAWGPAGGWHRSVPRAITRRRSDVVRRADQFRHTMEILGNRWSAVILAAAFLGTTRYSQFQHRLGVPATVLADRLDAFCANGVLDRRAAPDAPGRHEYLLTHKGHAFLPVVLTMIHWAERWARLPDEAPALEVSDEGGHELVPRWHCDVCDEQLDGGRDVVVVDAPSA